MPIFLIWIYLSWVIVLLGAVIAAYAPQSADATARAGPTRPAPSFQLALVVLRELGAARGDGRRGLERRASSPQRSRTDPLQIEPVLDALVALDWVGRLDEERTSARYVLLCDPATTRAEPLIAKLLLDPAPDLEATWQARRLRRDASRRAVAHARCHGVATAH